MALLIRAFYKIWIIIIIILYWHRNSPDSHIQSRRHNKHTGLSWPRRIHKDRHILVRQYKNRQIPSYTDVPCIMEVEGLGRVVHPLFTDCDIFIKAHAHTDTCKHTGESSYGKQTFPIYKFILTQTLTETRTFSHRRMQTIGDWKNTPSRTYKHPRVGDTEVIWGNRMDSNFESCPKQVTWYCTKIGHSIL